MPSETFETELTATQIGKLADTAPTYHQMLQRALAEMDGDPPNPTGWQILATIFDTLDREGGLNLYGWELDRYGQDTEGHPDIRISSPNAYFAVDVGHASESRTSGVLTRICRHLDFDERQFSLLASTLHTPPNPAIALFAGSPEEAVVWLPSKREYLSTLHMQTYTLARFQESVGQAVIAWK